LLCLEDAWFKYEDYVLKGASLCVERDKLKVLLGPMGSGKSTLLYALAALVPLERGKVTLDGEPFSDEHRRRVGLLFQNPEDQLFNATVFDEIAYALRSAGLDEEFVKEKVVETAARLGIEKLLNKNPFKLSYGQKKLVTLASILVYDPEFLLLDEPTANLDKRSYEKVLEIVLTSKGALVTTHEIEWIPLADEVYVLENGRVRKVEDIAAALEREELPVPMPLSWKLLVARYGAREALENLRASASAMKATAAIKAQTEPPSKPAGGLK